MNEDQMRKMITALQRQAEAERQYRALIQRHIIGNALVSGIVKGLGL